MPKIIRNTHISGEAGVIRFADYCNQHVPYIIFREVFKSDFGIDGEVELTKINEQQKTEPLGEIIKVQIKTTASDNSYIRNETTNTFEFYPRQEDFDYWQKYKKNGIDVLLVIYDQRNDLLYCRKITDTDMYVAKEHLKPGKKKNVNAVLFHKTENLLTFSDHNFTRTYSHSFKSRVSFEIKEYLLTNLMKYRQAPKLMYSYPTAFKTRKAIFDQIEPYDAPVFIVYGSQLFTFIDLSVMYRTFKEKVLTGGADASHQTITLKSILEDRQLKNRYVELLNIYVKDFLYTMKLRFQKDFSRYYFLLPKDETELKVKAKTRKRNLDSEKQVVKYFEYGKMKFFRHIAMECKHTILNGEVYLQLHPKYYFSTDGKTPLEPKTITKLTNFLTAREFNNHYADWLHFWWTYLSNGHDQIILYQDQAYANIKGIQKPGFYNKHLRIAIGPFVEIQVPFGIPTDIKEKKKTIYIPIDQQQSLF